jgi:hypothetical protein
MNNLTMLLFFCCLSVFHNNIIKHEQPHHAVTVEAGKPDEVATAGTVALNAWKEAHMIDGTFHTHINNIGVPHPNWIARPLNEDHVEDVIGLIKVTETVSNHIILVATASSKDNTGNFNFQVAEAGEEKMGPMLGNHTSTGLRKIHHEASERSYSDGLVQCYERVPFKVLYVDTDVRHSFASYKFHVF